jgi:hypothetical protein
MRYTGGGRPSGANRLTALTTTNMRGSIMAGDNPIPIWFLIQCFILDPGTPSGLRWRERPREHFPERTEDCAIWNGHYAGKPAGTPNDEGRWHVSLTFAGRKRSLKTHRICFALEHGRWPDDEVDHINGAESGNKADNLRAATHGQNMQNQKTNVRNTSGYPGVSPAKRRRGSKWHAQIGIDGRHIHLGYFDDEEEAFWAYLDARVEHFRFEPTPRDMSEAATACEAAWWFDRRRWRAIVWRVYIMYGVIIAIVWLIVIIAAIWVLGALIGG